MAIVTQTDKRTGITYAYETQYHWDKEKKQSRSKRVCVGKVDPATGKIIPTRGRAKKHEEKAIVTRPAPNLLFRRDICIMVPRICLISSQKNLDSQLI